jgi:hypothetical protein
MMLEFPKAYAVVRQGRQQVVSAADLDELIELRTELELVRLFGAGATAELIEAFDRRVAQVGRQDRDDPPIDKVRIEGLKDMRAVLSDSLAPVNRRAITLMDVECPQAKAGIAMESIEKDTEEFRDDVAEELGAADESDIDAMLAAFAEAHRPAEGEAPQAKADALTAEQSAPEELDEDLKALVANIEAGELSDSALAELAAAVNSPETSDAADSEPAESAVMKSESTEPNGTTADCLTGEIENVTEQMTESLTTAEAQLDGIVSAFEVAAAELGQVQSAVPASKPAESVPAAGEPAPGDLDASASSEAVSPASDASAPSTSSSASTQGNVAGSKPAGDWPAARPAGQMRTQLQQARANILSELDDLLVLLEQVDRMQVQADQAARKAQEFERAAARAQQAGQSLAVAEAEAAKARADFEQSQSRAAAARRTWEQAQQEASLAAAQTSLVESGR